MSTIMIETKEDPLYTYK